MEEYEKMMIEDSLLFDELIESCRAEEELREQIANDMYEEMMSWL